MFRGDEPEENLAKGVKMGNRDKGKEKKNKKPKKEKKPTSTTTN